MAKTSFTGPVSLGTYTVATAPVPAANQSLTGTITYFSNGANGSPIVAFYDGTNWLRVDTKTAISAT
jgi:hypothetical protein